MALMITVVLVLSVLLLLHLRLRFSHAGRLMARIPGPKGWPIIGDTFNIIHSPEKLFLLPRELFISYGNICKLDGFGVRTVQIFNADDVQTLFSTTRFNQKRQPYTFLQPWLRQGLLISNGEKWQRRRKLLTPSFHFNMLKRYIHTFNEQTEELLSKIQETTDKEINLFNMFSTTTLKVMCKTSLGTSMDEDIKSITSPYFRALYDFGDAAAYRITKIWLYLDFTFKFAKAFEIQARAVKYLHGFTTKIIKDRMKYFNDNLNEFNNVGEMYGTKRSLEMLDLLIQNEKEGKIDFEGIREEVDTFLFEGHDTTAMALCFMTMRIANEFEIQKRLFEEMNNLFGDSKRLPTVEDLNDMKYLECCIKESLRLYPSVPFISRSISEDVVLSGYKVPAGSQCHIHIYDIHHRKDYYPEPEKFVPERFLPKNTIHRHPYSFIPFSAGPRNCIGQKFAMFEMKTVMSGILRRFRLEPVTRPEDVVYKADIVLRSSNPLYVRFYPRSK